jgi:mgtE-like transporter
MIDRIVLKASVRGLSQSLLSLSIDLGGLMAGALLAYYIDFIESVPWALMIYPGILSVRGAIGGLLSGRLSTALHLGTIKPTFFNNTREARVLFHSVTALTLISSILMGAVSSVFGVLLGGMLAEDIVKVFLILMAAMGSSIVLVSPATFGFSLVSFRKGLDPDVMVYPFVSTFADIVITGCYMLILSLTILFPGASWWIIGFIDLVFIAFVCYRLRKDIREEQFIETIREFMLTLVFVSLIVNVTGSALSKIAANIGRRPEVYMIYPALIDTVGDVGSIVGSTATTKMALGLVSTSMSTIRHHLKEIGYAWGASIIMFCVFSLVPSLSYGFSVFWGLIVQLLSVNLLVIPVIILISYAVAIETRKRGLDPDNFIIPIETSLSDGITTLALLLVISLGL